MRQQLKTLASSTSADSMAASFRRRRFALFQDLISSLNHSPITILDLGGWQEFWEVMGFTDTPHKIILLNLHEIQVRYPNFTSIVGDARKLDTFTDKSVDVVFSNSVIEHLGTYENQKHMANEVRRVGKRYFIQTPNFFFPIEPHFIFPFFHWLPLSARLMLISRFSLGYIGRKQSREQAMRTLGEFRLLKKNEVKALFPDASIYSERVFGLTKSYIAVKP
ncbi:MAG: methyltransferase type 11 [Verrucomicrobia bacterium]|nr:MAG: methyltransferase type 11 [Verrucomicrobiota bacterium]